MFLSPQAQIPSVKIETHTIKIEGMAVSFFTGEKPGMEMSTRLCA